jgi:hypothetical protein
VQFEDGLTKSNMPSAKPETELTAFVHVTALVLVITAAMKTQSFHTLVNARELVLLTLISGWLASEVCVTK